VIEPPEPKYLDLVVSQNSVIGLQVESPVTTDSARVEDEVVARVTRDVRVGDRVAIPAGSKAHGEVTLVEKGGRLKDRARLGVRFTSIVLADGTRVPISTETIYREGDSPTGESAAKIGGAAIGGAILGGILGGGKGAAIGGAIGAGGGSAAVLAGGRNAATLSAGSPVTVRLEEPATVTVERE
jgi:type IV secretory pathway VirB10-like protein